MILSSPIHDRYVHECFSQPLVSEPEISSCSVTNFAEMSHICLSVRFVVFAMEFWLFWKFFPMNIAHFHVTAINIHQIIECSSPFPETLEIIICLFRTCSFTRFTNDLDSTDNSNSVSSFPMTKLWALASSWELKSSGRPDLPRSTSLYLTDCAVPSRRILSVIRSNLSYPSARSFIKSPWSIVRRDLSFPLLRRPSTVVIQFWITCWKEAFHELLMVVMIGGFKKICAFTRSPRSVLLSNWTPWILTPVISPSPGLLKLKTIRAMASWQQDSSLVAILLLLVLLLNLVEIVSPLQQCKL